LTSHKLASESNVSKIDLNLNHKTYQHSQYTALAFDTSWHLKAAKPTFSVNLQQHGPRSDF